ncbi:hypothetical protein [Duganella sp. S19_KUP01_CR8]|uniref:hypothetical protein n=1 Tax=Duganella sp. S19_KUP01_CR8 TaxID=3025502 RepID=UPI002FCDD4F2
MRFLAITAHAAGLLTIGVCMVLLWFYGSVVLPGELPTHPVSAKLIALALMFAAPAFPIQTLYPKRPAMAAAAIGWMPLFGSIMAAPIVTSDIVLNGGLCWLTIIAGAWTASHLRGGAEPHAWFQRAVIVAGLAILCIPVVLICAFALNSWRDGRDGKIFDRIELGATRADVIAMMGKADVSRPCGDNLWWGDDSSYRGKNDGRCVTEERYEHFLSAWGVGYSAEHRVVSKYHYFSE